MPGNIVNLTPATIATWPAPNYENPYQRAWMAQYAISLYAAASMMVIARLWLRAMRYSGGLGLDDALLSCGWLCITWFTVLAVVDAEQYMTNRHVWDIPLEVFAPMARITWEAEMAFLITGCCVKVSVLLFYRRMVRHSCSRAWIWTVFAAIAFTVSYTLAFTLTLVFNCSPTKAYWKAFDLTWAVSHAYHCADTSIINLLAGIMAAITDLFAVVLPCLILRRAGLPLMQKIALDVLFSLGLMVVTASVVRTYYLYQVAHSRDISTAIWNVFVWSQLELTLGIMCASAPSLRVLFRVYLAEHLSKLKRSVTSGRSWRRDVDAERMIARRPDRRTKPFRLGEWRVKHARSSSPASVPDPGRSSSLVADDKVFVADNLPVFWEMDEITPAPPPSAQIGRQKAQPLLPSANTNSSQNTWEATWGASPTPAKQSLVAQPILPDVSSASSQAQTQQLSMVASQDPEMEAPAVVRVRTPVDYECYNLQNVEKYRQSSLSRAAGLGLNQEKAT